MGLKARFSNDIKLSAVSVKCTSAWEHNCWVDEALVPMMMEIFVLRIFFGLHSQPGRSKQRPKEGKEEEVTDSVPTAAPRFFAMDEFAGRKQ